ncbi:exocyst complex component EXO70A1-like isoform X2 [Panicum hallii]|uniref:exocyst complex component EXO70A1-like isoform X2 n=1 Tax=Panicum hallii TaxID=206008 RepID=UPI000DF4E540|nr:exocyst complex component EXO70A1-like isoform X2 [Panicum hallii]
MERTGPGLPEGMEALSRQASALREALGRSEENTQGMVAALGSFDSRVSAIEASIRPAQVRTQAITMAHENIDRTIENAEAILAQFDIVRRAEAVILRGPHENLKIFLEAVDLLKGVVNFFSLNKNFKSCEGVLNQVNNLLTKSALKIEEEFRQLMGTYSKPIEPNHLFDCLLKHLMVSRRDSEAVGEQPSKSFETAIHPTLIPSGILPLLHDIACQLVQDGNQQSCYRIYRDARGSALELSLRNLGIEKLSKDDVERMQRVALQVNIGTWTQCMQITVKVLLAGERKICNQIFDGITFNKEQCFAELAKGSVMTLLSFGDTVARSKRSHENLFILLEMYGVMHELQSEVEVIFQGKFCSEMREAALNLTKSLAQVAQEILVDFEDAVVKDSSKTNMQNGTVHPFTFEVIKYVKSLLDYQSTLKILFQQPETGSETESQLAVVIMKIMQALQNNLNGKSKQYKDPALSHIFLMNNLHYMVTSVRRSQAKDILGDDWIQRHRKIVQQNANQYKRVAWARASVALVRQHHQMLAAVEFQGV